MRRVVTAPGVVLGLSVLLSVPLEAQGPAPVKALHAVELTDPAGDVGPIRLGDGTSHPGLDVIKMAIRSDGKQVTFAATLKEPPGPAGSDVLKVYVDTDNDSKTGAGLGSPKIGGFEYLAALHACASIQSSGSSSSTCAGGLDGKPTAHFAIVTLGRFKGPREHDKDDLVGMSEFPSMSGSPATKAAPRVPIAGTLVQASLDYAALGVKPGQTIRLVVKESSSDRAPDGGWFPDILLTLK